MSWSEGRRLSSLTAGGNTTTYTYDLNGLRNKKVNSDGTWVKYFIADGKIIGETRYPASGGYLYDMRYTFDENGDVCGISIWNNGDNHWTRYYFLKSLQGDFLAVYQYGDTFTKVAEYTYDSWGNVLTKSGTLADINPFRYRSYYQDSETGFYYLQSRYYDPSIGRFINADRYASTGQGFIGLNMFAYCCNNPGLFTDKYGTSATTAVEILNDVAMWLYEADGPYPYGDVLAFCILAVCSIIVADKTPKPDKNSSEKDSKGKKNKPSKAPDVTFPGNDPAKAPDGYVWRGSDSQGGKKGGYANPNGKDSWHPDLDHPDGIEPHWDYNDEYGFKWRVFPDRIEDVEGTVWLVFVD